MLLLLITTAAFALTLPSDFDADMNMRYKERSDGRLHMARESSYLARDLVAGGSPEEIALAVKVLDAVIACQETAEDSPRRGNFYWYLQDGRVTDRNAVAFILSRILPMMIEHGDRLPDETRQKVREAIRLGLEEIARIDVRVSYSNIAVKDFCNTLMGAELLDDPKAFDRGRKKLKAWMDLTASNGIPVEFNSPTYYRVSTRSLKSLVRCVEDDDTRIRAKTALARLGLTKALHIHPATGRMSGPHGRAYHPTVVGEDAPEVGQVREWIEEGTLPGWIADALTHQPPILEIEETAYREWDLGISTYHTPSFGLGVSTRDLWSQSNVLISHYKRPGQERHGVIYTRYLTNEKWLGSFYHRTDRSASRNLSEEGRFVGMQQGGRALGFYTQREPRGRRRSAPDSITSAKGNIIWTGREAIDEIWVGKRRVDTLPVDISEGEAVVVVSGDAMTAVRPLERSAIGNAPLRLQDKDGDLVLEMYTYQGDPVLPSQLDSLNTGRLQCPFYLEMVERSTFPSGRAFAEFVASGTIDDRTEIDDDGKQVRHVAYRRGGESIGIEVDVSEWAIKRRWTQDGDLGLPMLESSIARQNSEGRVAVGEAVLTCGQEPAWLFAPPGTGRYVAAYHGQTPGPITLSVPDGKVEVAAMGVGMIVWDNGVVTIEAVDLAGTPKVTGGRLVAR